MGNIDLERGDPIFKKEIMQQPGGERISVCFACHTCTASCPISAINSKFNPLRIIRKTLYGLREQVLGSDFIWLCSNCYACQERCPQGVSITEFMTLLKNMAVEKGYLPAGIKAQRDLVKGEGRVYPIDDFDNKKRAKLGLPGLPTTCDAVERLFPRA